MEKNLVTKFAVNLLLFSLSLGAIAYCLTFTLPTNYFSPALPYLFPFFFAFTILMFNFLIKSNNKKFNSFVNRFMIVTLLKLMIYMAVLVIYVFSNKPDAVPFILSFFLLYLAYTAFEVVALLKFSKTEKK